MVSCRLPTSYRVVEEDRGNPMNQHIGIDEHFTGVHPEQQLI